MTNLDFEKDLINNDIKYIQEKFTEKEFLDYTNLLTKYKANREKIDELEKENKVIDEQLEKLSTYDLGKIKSVMQVWNK